MIFDANDLSLQSEKLSFRSGGLVVPTNIHSYFVDALNEYLSQNNEFHKKVDSDYYKVTKYFIGFAGNQNMTLEKLTFLHICNFKEKIKLNPELLSYIQSVDHTEDYKQQIRTRITGILKILFDHKNTSKGTCNETDSDLPVPEFLIPVLKFLPKRRPYKSTFDFSMHGKNILIAILTVIDRFNIDNLYDLFNLHRSELYKTLRNISPRAKIASATSAFSRFIDKCKEIVEILPNDVISVPFEQFPPMLKTQVEMFRKNARTGLRYDPILCASANEKEIQIDRLQESTIEQYISNFGLGLGRLKEYLTEDLEIRDFLRLKNSVIEDEDGDEYIYRFNPLIEALRKMEREKSNQYKEIGFDSASFNSFIVAVKAIAAFNGIFKFHKSFNEVYRVNLDFNTKESLRENKKATFNLDWIDSEISRLLPEFEQIIKDELFKPNLTKRSSEDTAINVRFCLFFVQFVTMRYMGFRQQQIRKCKLKENIVFRSDGTISFHWPKGFLKNKKDYRATVSSKKYKGTHGILLDVLNLYNSVLRPYLDKSTRGAIGDDFFLSMDDNRQITKISGETAKGFYERFTRWANSFLDFSSVDTDEEKLDINPHFLRGVCVDWLYYKLGVTLRNVADYIGDTERTVLKYYLKKATTADAQAALDEANRNLYLNKKISDILKDLNLDSDFDE